MFQGPAPSGAAGSETHIVNLKTTSGSRERERERKTVFQSGPCHQLPHSIYSILFNLRTLPARNPGKFHSPTNPLFWITSLQSFSWLPPGGAVLKFFLFFCCFFEMSNKKNRHK